jgi:hypothetical protein
VKCIQNAETFGQDSGGVRRLSPSEQSAKTLLFEKTIEYLVNVAG